MILNIPFISLTQTEFIEQLTQHIEAREKAFVITANPEVVMKAKRDAQLMHILTKATYITADGIGIVKAAKKLKQPLPGRVTGYDTTIGLLQKANEKKYKIYLLGASEDTIEKTVNNIEKQYPNIEIVGYHHGFFDLNDQSIANEIKEKQPDITFVALGVPRQEQWIYAQIDKIQHGIFIGVGGTFDVIAGTVKRAPNFWIKLNLEWFYRLIKQPSRFIRMLDLPKFMWHVHREQKKK